MAGNSSKVVVYAISGNLFITIIKFIGWFFSKSPSMLAEGVHSLADTINQILLLIGLKQSLKESSAEHPTGHGNARYMWNLISAVGIFFLGFGVTLYHGLHSLFEGGGEPTKASFLTVGILVVSLIIEGYILLQAYKEVKKEKGEQSFIDYLFHSDNPTNTAVLLEDGVAVLGVLLALGGIILGEIFQSSLFDVVSSIFIAILLGFMAIILGFVNGKLLIGKSSGKESEQKVKKFVESFKEVDKVISISTKILGASNIRLSLEVTLIGEQMIDYSKLKLDAEKISNGESPYRVLVKSSDRMIRSVGNTINEIENKIYLQFPRINHIDLEID